MPTIEHTSNPTLNISEVGAIWYVFEWIVARRVLLVLDRTVLELTFRLSNKINISVWRLGKKN